MDFFKIREQTAEFTRLTIAQDHMQLGEWDEAIQQLEAIRQTRRLSMVEVYISLARAYLHRGSPNDAAAILAVAEEGLQLHPSTPELLWYAVVGRVQMADWPHARLWIEQYVLAEPGDVRGLHLAHLVATQQNRHADAQEALRRAQSIDPHIRRFAICSKHPVWEATLFTKFRVFCTRDLYIPKDRILHCPEDSFYSLRNTVGEVSS